MSHGNNPLDALRYHVTGAVERGERESITAVETFDTHLTMSWSISKGRDTYGYNICRLTDDATGKRYRCMGGGYDMQGTVFAEWLQSVYQDRLVAIADQAHARYVRNDTGPWERQTNDAGLYGFTFTMGEETARIDGACGLDSVERIARAIGLSVRHQVSARGRLTGFVVADRVI